MAKIKMAAHPINDHCPSSHEATTEAAILQPRLVHFLLMGPQSKPAAFLVAPREK